MNNIKQFKLTNNEEIICEIVEWDTADEVGDILVKKALKVIAVEDYQKGWRFFAFRPWMSFQEDPEILQTINSSHIIVTSNPTERILKHYKACLDSIKSDLNPAGIVKKKKIYANLDEIQDAMRDLTDDEMDDYLEAKYGSMVESNINDSYIDSSDNKIIKFNPKRDKTFH